MQWYQITYYLWGAYRGNFGWAYPIEVFCCDRNFGIPWFVHYCEKCRATW